MKYKKASIILDQVAEELSSYDEQGLIDNTKLYKVLRTCNATLSLRINPEKQIMVRINNFKGPTPKDFEALNFAFICHKKIINTTKPQGFHVEYKTFSEWQPKNNSCCIFEKKNETVIVQKCNEEWQEFHHFDIPKITKSTVSVSQSLNHHSRYHHTISITPNEIVTDFREGDLYLNYVGSMEDDDDDLLVYDHPLVEPYYEAAVIKHVLKLVYRNKEADVGQVYAEVSHDFDRAKIQAVSFVNTTEYTEIRDLYQAQRVRLWNKYAAPILGWN